MELTQYVLLGAVIAGMTELLTRLRARDYWVALTIALAALIGGIFGYFHVEGLPTVVHGIAAGFGASGAITILSAFGNKSVASPSNAIK
jgi:uncharacterized membrane protein HdeD (DUF308 family)